MAAILASALLTAGAAPTSAAPPTGSPGGITVQPLLITASPAPGDVLTREVSITNSGTGPTHIRFEHADLEFEDDTYAVHLIEDAAGRTSTYSTRGWISARPEQFMLAPGTSRTVRVTITVPAEAHPDTRLGAALFRINDASDVGDAGDQRGIVTSTRTGTLVILDVGGDGTGRPQLDSVSAPRRTTTGRIPVRISASADSPTRVGATVTLRGRGETWSTSAPARALVPGIPRSLSSPTSNSLTVGPRTLADGRYRLTVRLTDDEGRRVATETRTVWVIRPRSMVALVFLAAGLILATVLLIRWRRPHTPDGAETELTGHES